MEYVRLKDIGRIITGNTPPTSKPEYYGDYMPFIKATDISLGAKCTLVTEQMYSELAAEKYKESLVPKGSTCVVTIGSIGKKMTYAHTNLFVNQAINAIIPKNSYDKEYVYYTIRYSVLPQLKKLDSGTTSGRENVSKSSFSGIRIPVIKDKSVQHRIASILSAYDSLIENNTKRIRLLEKMAENLYKEWFVRFRFPGYEKAEMENGLPKGWKVERFGEWGISLDTGKRPKGGVDISLKDGYPSLGAECIKELAFFDYSSVSLIPKDFYESMKRGKNTGDDILLYKDGAYIGKVTMFMDKYPYEHYAINEHVFFVAPKNVEYKNYLYFTLHQNEFFVLMQNLNRNAAQPGLSRGDVERVQMTIPTSEVVKQFNQVVKPMLKIMFNLAKQNTLLARRRDLLLPRLISGKLEVKP